MTLLLPVANQDLLPVTLQASSDSCRPFLVHPDSHSEAGQLEMLILLINKFRRW